MTRIWEHSGKKIHPQAAVAVIYPSNYSCQSILVSQICQMPACF